MIIIFCIKLLLLITRSSYVDSIDDEYRLLDNVELDNYQIKLKLHDDFETFTGSVSIIFETTYQTDTFKLNYVQLSGLNDKNNYNLVEHLNNTSGFGKVYQIREVSLFPSKEILIITTKSVVPANKLVKLTINEYSGRLADNMHGFYKSTYGDDQR